MMVFKINLFYDTRIVCFNNINWMNIMTIPSGPLRENINEIKKYNHFFKW